MMVPRVFPDGSGRATLSRVAMRDEFARIRSCGTLVWGGYHAQPREPEYVVLCRYLRAREVLVRGWWSVEGVS
jgi:hypothetical protein